MFEMFLWNWIVSGLLCILGAEAIMLAAALIVTGAMRLTR